ncbi:hypothetical protein MMC22_011318, partial [Lobaria immixta]|nr:hypothetical protein [Lobaria immixta]
MSTSEAKDSFPILQGSDNHSKWMQHANSILKPENCEDGIQPAKIHNTKWINTQSASKVLRDLGVAE